MGKLTLFEIKAIAYNMLLGCFPSVKGGVLGILKDRSVDILISDFAERPILIIFVKRSIRCILTRKQKDSLIGVNIPYIIIKGAVDAINAKFLVGNFLMRNNININGV